MDDEGTPVGIYARISENRSKDAEGVDDQVRRGHRLAQDRGWTVVDVFVDNDIAALTGGHRPDYERLMEVVAAGKIKRIIVFHLSRLWRNRIERAEGIKALRAAGVSVTQVKGPELDLTSAYGRAMTGLLGEFDTMESEIKSERVAAAVHRRAEAGKWHGGITPFGYRTEETDELTSTGKRRLRLVVDPVNAGHLKDAARRVLGGESLYSIAQEWRVKGSPKTTRGAQWRGVTIRAALLTPSAAGLRELDGKLIEAPWPAVLDRKTWDRLRERLTREGRSLQPVSGDYVGKLPLVGLVFCDRCGRKLTHHKTLDHVRLVCHSDTPPAVDGPTKCGQVTVKYAPLEAFLLDLVLARLDSPAWRKLVNRRRRATAEEDTLREELRSFDAKRVEIGDNVVDGLYTREDARRKAADIARREEQVREKLARLTADLVLADVTTVEDARRLWDAGDVTRRRRFLASLIDEVRVARYPEGVARTLRRKRAESEEAFAARAFAHERTVLRGRITIKWRA